MGRTQLLIFIGVAILLLIAGSLIFGRKPAEPAPATLELWGIGDDAEVWDQIIRQFSSEKPYITVRYTRFDQDRFEETLINRLAEGRGPDVFILPNTLAKKHKDKVYVLPQDFFGVRPRDFKEIFADISAEDLITFDNQILGVPLFIDSLALYYNKDQFNSAGIAVLPRTWDELAEAAKKITKRNAAGDIIRSAIALGSFQNIEHAYEIVVGMFIQRNEIEDQGLAREAEETLRFYASFSEQGGKNFTWTPRLRHSINSFAEEASAMMVGFSEDLQRIKARNAHISVGIAPLPQFADTKDAAYGRYFFASVSRATKSPQAAWELLLFLASKEGAKKYSELTGRPPARRDLISEGTPNSGFEVFWKQALIAKSWSSPDENGTRKLMQSAVEGVVSRAKTPSEAIQEFNEQFELLGL